jgi:hypothetical protein
MDVKWGMDTTQRLMKGRRDSTKAEKSREKACAIGFQTTERCGVGYYGSLSLTLRV